MLPSAPAIRKEALATERHANAAQVTGGNDRYPHQNKIRKVRHRGNISSGALPRIFSRPRRGNEAEASLHRTRIPCNRPTLFQKRLSDVRNGRGQQLCLLFLGSTKNKVDKAFGHSRCHLSNIDRLLPLNMLLNHVIDLHQRQEALRAARGEMNEAA